MNLLDVAAGIGQGIPTAIQNVGNIANIQNDQERLELTRKAQENAKLFQEQQLANEGIRLQHEGERTNIAKQGLVLQQEEAAQKRDLFNRAKLEYEKEHAATIPVAKVIEAHGKGPRERAWIQNSLNFVDPQAAKTGMISPAALKKVSEYGKAHEDDRLDAVLKDHREEQDKLKEEMLKLSSFVNNEKDFQKALAKAKQDPALKTPAEQVEYAKRLVAAEKEPEVRRLASLMEQSKANEFNLMAKYERVQKAREAMAKEIKSKEQMYIEAFGGDVPNALRAMQEHEMNLRRVEALGKQTGKLPEPMVKALIGEVENKYSGIARGIYNAELAKYNALSDSQKKAVIASNPMIAEIVRISRGNPEKIDENITNPAFVSMVLPPQHKQMRIKELGEMAALLRPFEITTQPGEKAVPSPQVANPAPTGNGLQVFNEATFTKAWKDEFTKNPQRLNNQKEVESIMKSLNMPEEKQALLKVIKEIQGAPKPAVAQPATTQKQPSKQESAIPINPTTHGTLGGLRSKKAVDIEKELRNNAAIQSDPKKLKAFAEFRAAELDSIPGMTAAQKKDILTKEGLIQYLTVK